MNGVRPGPGSQTQLESIAQNPELLVVSGAVTAIVAVGIWWWHR